MEIKTSPSTYLYDIFKNLNFKINNDFNVKNNLKLEDFINIYNKNLANSYITFIKTDDKYMKYLKYLWYNNLVNDEKILNDLNNINNIINKKKTFKNKNNYKNNKKKKKTKKII